MTPGASSFSAGKLAAVPAPGPRSGRERLVFWVGREISDLGSECLLAEDEGIILEAVSVKDEDMLGGMLGEPSGSCAFTSSLVSTKKAVAIALLALGLPPGHS